MALRRLNREYATFQTSPPPNMTASPASDADLFTWKATLCGPTGTPYSEGVFPLSLVFPAEYPNKAPKVTFSVPVYHPSVNENGEICLDILKTEWKPTMTVVDILNAVEGLLTDPTANDKPLMAAIAEEARSNRAQFDETARAWTEKHAKK
eukprot:PhF_6_TR4975/c0_g1_i1/m.7044/K06689/UBE2D, UBC4, UBC5; ubiquitin-conjugating enzyme E2 D